MLLKRNGETEAQPGHEGGLDCTPLTGSACCQGTRWAARHTDQISALMSRPELAGPQGLQNWGDWEPVVAGERGASLVVSQTRMVSGLGVHEDWGWGGGCHLFLPGFSTSRSLNLSGWRTALWDQGYFFWLCS